MPPLLTSSPLVQPERSTGSSSSHAMLTTSAGSPPSVGPLRTKADGPGVGAGCVAGGGVGGGGVAYHGYYGSPPPQKRLLYDPLGRHRRGAAPSGPAPLPRRHTAPPGQILDPPRPSPRPRPPQQFSSRQFPGQRSGQSSFGHSYAGTPAQARPAGYSPAEYNRQFSQPARAPDFSPSTSYGHGQSFGQPAVADSFHEEAAAPHTPAAPPKRAKASPRKPPRRSFLASVLSRLLPSRRSAKHDLEDLLRGDRPAARDFSGLDDDEEGGDLLDEPLGEDYGEEDALAPEDSGYGRPVDGHSLPPPQGGNGAHLTGSAAGYGSQSSPVFPTANPFHGSEGSVNAKGYLSQNSDSAAYQHGAVYFTERNGGAGGAMGYRPLSGPAFGRNGSDVVTGYLPQNGASSHSSPSLPFSAAPPPRGTSGNISVIYPRGPPIPFRAPGDALVSPAPDADEASAAAHVADDIAESFFGRPLAEMETCEREADAAFLPSIRGDPYFTDMGQMEQAQDPVVMQGYAGYRHDDSGPTADAGAADNIAESFFGRPLMEMECCEREADAMLPSIYGDGPNGKGSLTTQGPAVMQCSERSQDHGANADDDDAAEDLAEAFFGRPLREMENCEREADSLLPSIRGDAAGGGADLAAAQGLFRAPGYGTPVRRAAATGGTVGSSGGRGSKGGGAVARQRGTPRPASREGYVRQFGKFLWRSVRTIFTFSTCADARSSAGKSPDMDV